MRYRLAKRAPDASSVMDAAGAVAAACVASIRIVAIELVVPPIERITPVVMLTSGIEATGSGCGSHFSCTCSRVEPLRISPPAD